MAARLSVPEIPQELLGKWIAWDREQKQIVGWGDTFDAAKHAAGQAGWREVVIAKSEPKSRWLRGQHLLCMAAVFISQAADAIGDFSDFVS
jgi:hypothetical protein